MSFFSVFEKEVYEFLDNKKDEYILQIINGTNINNFEEYKNIQGRLASILLVIKAVEDIHNKIKSETKTY